MNVLEGIKVVDVTAWAFVPSAGGVLAHWGAQVVKVESPSGPDPMRLLGGTLDPGGASWFFKHYSRGKRSIAINLASEEGREIIYKLAAEADVFLTSYLPATRKKLRIDVDDIRAVNPRIIYARGSGRGPRGPSPSARATTASPGGAGVRSPNRRWTSRVPPGQPEWSATATACRA
jgi:crotonobetainyl-CoA:carnitine CoA-transferase CaiB-like acyl-CoA transferase